MVPNKVFKKGEIIFKEGDKSTAAYLIQSGSVQVYLQKSKQKIDLYRLGAMQILSEQVLAGGQTHSATAVALAETKVLELPPESIKTQIAELNQVMRLILKSTMDKLKLVNTELRSVKLERDNTPCPQDQTAKAFASFYHTLLHKAEKKTDTHSMSWVLCKHYAQRMFVESPKRLENIANIFIKHKFASFTMMKDLDNPDGPEVIDQIIFKNLQVVEDFFEFYQYYYFKGSKLDILKTDENSGKILTYLLELSKTATPDRHGAVRFPYQEVVDKLKAQYHFNLNSDHFSILEQKGIFARRQSTDQGVFLSFDLKEWQRMLMNWKILKEIEVWNEKGHVDSHDPAEDFWPKQEAKGKEHACPSCHAKVPEDAKFCMNCGHKLGPQAKAA